MKTTPHFPILSPGDPGYSQALSRAKRVFAGKETGWKLADCAKVKGYAIKTPKGYFATQGNQQWCQDTPDGWALFSTEQGARDVLEYASHVEGEIETITA